MTALHEPVHMWTLLQVAAVLVSVQSLNGSDGVHKSREATEKLAVLKEDQKQKYRISLLNTVMPYLIEELDRLCGSKNICFSLSDGHETHMVSMKWHLPKRHSVDGYAISLSGRTVSRCRLPEFVYRQRRFKRKSAVNIQKLNFREYYVLSYGKEVLVARNQHKVEGQKDDSLEEHMSVYASDHTEEECDVHLRGLIVKPAKRTYLVHRENLWSATHVGDIVKYKKFVRFTEQIKQMVFITTKIRIKNGESEHGTESKKSKFCKTTYSTCIPFTGKESV